MTAAPTLHIVLSGGGTGGHLFPGLATAECLQSLRPDVHMTVAGTGPEWLGRQVCQAGYRYRHLPCRPMPTRLVHLFRFAVDSLAAYYGALRYLAAHRAAVVVGLGGYASVPMARAALARRIPLVLLEQNVVPGKATRFLARHARAVCLAFPESADALPATCPIHLTGNPVRRAFTVAGSRGMTESGGRRSALGRSDAPLLERNVFDAAKDGRVSCDHPGPPQLLVLGGSGGAQALNQGVPEVLGRLRSALGTWRIVHQAGARDTENTARRYAAAGLHATVVPWLDDMPGAMRRSALAISRAGGTTLAELAAAGLPAVVVPYPHAAADHQRANAAAFWAAGAAEVVQQHGGPVPFDRALHDALAHLLVQPLRLAEMRAAMLRQARPDAAETVARLVLECAGARQWKAASQLLPSH